METKRTLIITGGQIELEFAKTYLSRQLFDYTIVVDHGLHVAHKLGITPNAIVGDFDSVDSELINQYRESEITHIYKYQPEKDDTDTELAIHMAIEIKSTEVVLLGATGTRMDHTLANIQLLKQFLEHKIKSYILDANNKIYLIEEEITLFKKLVYGNYISLIPFTESVNDVTLTGFKYPLFKHKLMQGESLGISNEIVENEARISFTCGILLVMETQD